MLGVNLKALENSVKARYGTEIDATAYLQKFLSFTLNLPDHIGDQARTPAVIRYVSHLGLEMATPKHLLDEVNVNWKSLGDATTSRLGTSGRSCQLCRCYLMQRWTKEYTGVAGRGYHPHHNKSNPASSISKTS